MNNDNPVAFESIHLGRVIAELQMFERLELAKTQELSKAAAIDVKKEDLQFLPPKVDYAPKIRFVRHQGAYACGMNAAAACWDVMNELISPYSPNLSVNRMIWLWSRELKRDQMLTLLECTGQQPQNIPKACWEKAFGVGVDYQKFVLCLPGLGKSYQSSDEYFADFGCPTEGTELTDSNAVKWPTPAGDGECPNYRLKLTPTDKPPGKTCWVPVNVDVDNLRYHLVTKPLRAVVFNGKHFFTLIGYEDATQRFKFINSWGDQWNDPVYYAHDGYGYIEYSKLNQLVQGVEYLLTEPPKPVPTVRVSFNHNRRQDVSLFLYGKQPDGAITVKQIWPSCQREDNSRNLTLTVTLPVGCVWPPSPANMLYLLVFDSGAYSLRGGDLVEFCAAFSGEVFTCTKLKTGPAKFIPTELATFSIP